VIADSTDRVRYAHADLADVQEAVVVLGVTDTDGVVP
jgi:hypothetical protein